MRTQPEAAHLEYQVPKQVSKIFADTLGTVSVSRGAILFLIDDVVPHRPIGERAHARHP